jgi:putative spermidine/putrescine transport system permease protein
MTSAGASVPFQPAGESTLRRWRRRFFPFALLLPSAIPAALFIAAMVLLFFKSLHAFVGTEPASAYSLATWREFLGSGFYWSVVKNTVELGLIVTGACLLLGYPTAYVLARIRSRALTTACYVVLFSPLLVSVVVRSYGWMLLLGERGFVNSVLGQVPGFHPPYQLMFNNTGVRIALVHILLPFAIFPILSVMRQVSPTLGEAAADLGARPWQTWLKVTLPLTLPGVVSAAQIVFTLTISAWVTASLLGGGRVQVVGELIYQNISQLNWPLGSVESFVLLLVALIALTFFNLVARIVRPKDA